MCNGVRGARDAEAARGPGGEIDVTYAMIVDAELKLPTAAPAVVEIFRCFKPLSQLTTRARLLPLVGY